ncbi:MAG: hypothetical protein KAQ68_05155 [Clostridiales bacterium]|nr:hypothetical protein [Clostridiales bacterium]
MAKLNKMVFDKTEILCLYEAGETKISRRTRKISLLYNNVQSVAIKPCTERKGLKVIDSERITIRTSKLPRPIEYYKWAEGKYFDEYKAGLRLFCKQNRITMYDEVE